MKRYEAMVGNLDGIHHEHPHSEGVLDQKAKDIELLYLRLGSVYDGYYDRLAMEFWQSK
jgi:hypothetical protein